MKSSVRSGVPPGGGLKRLRSSASEPIETAMKMEICQGVPIVMNRQSRATTQAPAPKKMMITPGAKNSAIMQNSPTRNQKVTGSFRIATVSPRLSCGSFSAVGFLPKKAGRGLPEQLERFHGGRFIDDVERKACVDDHIVADPGVFHHQQAAFPPDAVDIDDGRIIFDFHDL